MLFLLHGLVINPQQQFHISFSLQQLPHFLPCLTIFSIGLLLFRKERSILSPQGFDRGQLLQPQLIKGFLCSLVQSDLALMLCKELLGVTRLPVCCIHLTGLM